MPTRFKTGLMQLGSWEALFQPRPTLLDELIPGHHIRFYRGRELRFSGKITEPGRIEDGAIVISGPGPEDWLGSDDKHGAAREPQDYTSLRTDQIVDNLLFRQDGSRALNPGTLSLGNVIGLFSTGYKTAQSKIRTLAASTRTEYRINHDAFTLDWAGNTNGGKIGTTRSIVFAKAARTAKRVTYEPTAFEAAGKVVVLGAGEGAQIIVSTATAALPAAWKDWKNDPYQADLIVDAPNADTAEQAGFVASAQLGLHQSLRKRAEVELSSDRRLADLAEGDTVYVYEPQVLEDLTQAVRYKGRLYPAVALRVQTIDVECGPGWRLVLRKPDGTEKDLTKYARPFLSKSARVVLTLSSEPEQFYDIDISEVVTDTRTTPQPGDPSADTTIPAAPAGLTVTPSTYEDYAGQQRARLKFSWTAVTQNTDATAIQDLQGYIVRYRRVAGSPTAWETIDVFAPTVEAAAEDLPVGITWEAQVLAYDTNGNESAWAPASPVNTSSSIDTTPPPQPMTPVATGGIGMVFVEWDHKDASNNAMPPDIRWYEVHASTSSGFTPTPSTLKGETNATLFSFNAGTGTYFVKLIAVDYAGNKSTASAQSGGATSRLVGTVDIDVQAVSAANIADGAVATAKLADGAVITPKIAAGVITADKLVVGNFDNLVEDPSFEKNSVRWASRQNGFTNVIDPTNSRVGTRCGRLQGAGEGVERFVYIPAGSVAAGLDGRVDCRAGDEFYYEFFAKSSAGTNNNIALFVRFVDAAGVELTFIQASGQLAPTTTYTQISGVFTAPNLASYWEAYVTTFTGLNGTWFTDTFYMKKTVISAYISDAAIITAKIADAAITTAKIVDAAIVTAKIGNLAVNTAQIADLAVNTAKLGDAVITTAKIADLAVVTAKIADAAINNAKLQDAQITNAKIADATIQSAKIVSLVADKIATGSLVAAVDITSGIIRTGSGNPRAELDSAGLQLISTSGQGATNFANDAQAVHWHRNGGGLYGELRGRFTTGGIQEVMANVKDIEGSGHARFFGQVFDGGGATAAQVGAVIDASAGPYQAFIRAWDGGAVSSRVECFGTAQSGGHKIYIEGLARLSGAGMIYENGFTAAASGVTAGSFATVAVSYGTAFPASVGAPYIVGGMRDGTSERGNWRAINRTTSGCDIVLANMTTITETYGMVGLPVIP